MVCLDATSLFSLDNAMLLAGLSVFLGLGAFVFASFRYIADRLFAE